MSMLSALLGLLLSGCGGSSKIEELREQLLGKDVEEARQFLAVYQEGRRHADEKTLVFSADR